MSKGKKAKPYQNRDESYDFQPTVDSVSVAEFKSRKHIGSNRSPKKKKRK